MIEKWLTGMLSINSNRNKITKGSCISFVDPPLRVGVIPSHPDYTDAAPVYENLPQQKSNVSSVKHWAAILNNNDTVSGHERRRSNLQLMTPKPFTPYNNQTNHSYPSVTSPEPQPSFSRTPPPPPVRGQKLIQPEIGSQSYSSLPVTMTTTVNGHVSPSSQRSPLGQSSSPGQRDLLKVPAWEKPVPRNKRIIVPKRSNKGRYLTISSSQPVKLEKSSPQSPKLHSQAGDLITSVSIQ